MKKGINSALKAVNYEYVKKQIDDAFCLLERHKGTPDAVAYARKLRGLATVLVKKTEMEINKRRAAEKRWKKIPDGRYKHEGED